MALAEVGFKVAALTPAGNPARRTRAVERHYAHRRWPALVSTLHAIEDWSPDFLVCCDDLSVDELQRLYLNIRAANNEAHRPVADLIEAALGAPAMFQTAREKSRLIPFAKSANLRCPQTTVLPGNKSAEPVLGTAIYPFLVKGDKSRAGRCVRVVRNQSEAATALWELQTPATWRRSVRKAFGRLVGRNGNRQIVPTPRHFRSLQEYVAGSAANRAVVCWEGEVLCGFSTEVIEMQYEFGPSTVAKFVENAEMTVATEVLVRRIKLSGFAGFDFILDGNGQAWLIELNPRATPSCHLCLANGTDLAGALFARVTGTPARKRTPIPTLNDTIAFFPQELQRASNSEYLASCFHDVPWNEPDFVQACLAVLPNAKGLERL